ncbi:Alpha/Beta hydrolase protein [Absidia repens]|uniref:Alpha/Beta hydrolase protein n=1 Tax=Absidia repens TaxID=90262 RepID=A0A1X2I414_9FUNG|nr:Alpha/Beta hydrolase protein [Absidia repens]
MSRTISLPSHQQRLQELKVDEEITQDETYYARRWGYDCQQYNARTKDGYILKMYRFSTQGNKKLDSEPPRKPVLIGHGLFQCSGDFVLNEKESLVFTLVDQGYDVWTGNNRAVGSTEHTNLSQNDPCYWNWGLKELGLYDLPAMLDHIRETTGHKKVGYIGHSQGNAQAFIALSLQPELADKMSCFIALAPAVVSGSLVTTFPIRLLIHLNRKSFRFLFGKKAFLGMMTTAQKHLPPSIMSTLAYSVFSYLFAWWDHHWVQRRKIKYFQYTPRPVSTRLLLDWLEGWGRQGVCLHINTKPTNAPSAQCVPQQQEKIPLAIIYGSDDYLVDGASFVRSFEGYENHGLMEDEWNRLDQHQEQQQQNQSFHSKHSFCFPTLQLVLVKRIPGYEHMDTIWAHDNTITSFPAIIDMLGKASWETTH